MVLDQVPNKDNAVTYLANPCSRYLACTNDHIVDGSISGRDTYSPIDIDNGLEEFPIKGLFPHGDRWVISMEDELEKELIAIQISGSSPYLTPEYRDIICLAKVEVHLLSQILMEADTDIWCGR